MATHEFLRSSRGRMKDSLLVLKAKGTVATSMVGESPLGTDKYIDTGGGRTRGDMVINVYDFSHSTLATSKLITFRLQGSKNTSFTTGCDLVITEIGKANMLTGDSSLATTAGSVPTFLEGRYVIPFSNDFDGTAYRYLRHYVTLGTNSGLQYDCYLSKIYS